MDTSELVAEPLGPIDDGNVDAELAAFLEQDPVPAVDLPEPASHVLELKSQQPEDGCNTRVATAAH